MQKHSLGSGVLFHCPADWFRAICLHLQRMTLSRGLTLLLVTMQPLRALGFPALNMLSELFFLNLNHFLSELLGRKCGSGSHLFSFDAFLLSALQTFN